MATSVDLLVQLSVVNCNESGLLGTGQEGCNFDWDRVETIELTPRGFAYEEEQNLAYIQEQQQKSKVIILKGIKSFKLVPVEPEVSTAEGSGYETVTGELPYKYEIMFDNNGVNFWKALRMLNSKDRFNVAFYDVTGAKIFTQTKAGVVKGFSTKMIYTGQYKGKEGNTAAESKMTIQLADSVQEMARQTWITGDNLDFSPTDLSGQNDVNISLAPVAVAATTIVATVLLIDKSHFLDGTVLTDYRVKKNGTVIVPSGFASDSNAKTVTFTIPAATLADIYTVETWDSTTLGNVIVSPATGLVYKSNVATVVVV